MFYVVDWKVVNFLSVNEKYFYSQTLMFFYKNNIITIKKRKVLINQKVILRLEMLKLLGRNILFGNLN